MDLICIVCPNSCRLTIKDGVVSGHKCKRGEKFAIEESTCPKRTICTTVKTSIEGIPVLPVRTDGEIPKEMIFDLMKLVSVFVLDRRVARGEIIIENILDTGVNLISTSDILTRR